MLVPSKRQSYMLYFLNKGSIEGYISSNIRSYVCVCLLCFVIVYELILPTLS